MFNSQGSIVDSPWRIRGCECLFCAQCRRRMRTLFYIGHRTSTHIPLSAMGNLPLERMNRRKVVRGRRRKYFFTFLSRRRMSAASLNYVSVLRKRNCLSYSNLHKHITAFSILKIKCTYSIIFKSY